MTEDWRKVVQWNVLRDALESGQASPKPHPWAIACLLGGIIATILLVAIVLFFRFELVTADHTLFRLDRWSGTVTVCLAENDNPLQYRCSGKVSDWVEPASTGK
jgi:hypothetical protein